MDWRLYTLLVLCAAGVVLTDDREAYCKNAPKPIDPCIKYEGMHSICHCTRNEENQVEIDCSHAQLCDANFNKLSGCDDCEIMIDLSHNYIKEITKENFLPNMGTNKVIEVNLSNNTLTKVDKHAFENARGLKRLYINNCSLEDISFLKDIEGLGKLEQLELRNNGITKFHNETFFKLENLVELDLSKNKLAPKIPVQLLKKQEKLQVLKLDSCELGHEHMNDEGSKGKLAFLHQDSIRETLKRLSIKDNRFTSLPIMPEFDRLEQIDYSYSMNIEEIGPGHFSPAKSLERIVMTFCPYMWAVSANTFKGLTSLRQVIIANNKRLYEISAEAFGDTPEFDDKVELNFENNAIDTLDISRLPLDMIDVIKVGHNGPSGGRYERDAGWHCNCHMGGMIDAAAKGKLDPKELRCATPAKHKGLLLKEVDKTTLECTRNRGGGALFGVLMALLLAGCFVACLAYNGVIPCLRRRGATHANQATFSRMKLSQDEAEYGNPPFEYKNVPTTVNMDEIYGPTNQSASEHNGAAQQEAINEWVRFDDPPPRAV